jgi:hypothetical protein
MFLTDPDPMIVNLNFLSEFCSDPDPNPYGTLKVHKNENFFGFNFEFCTISMLVMHK